jgi:ferredoxin-NADP reductase/MOSC domain-containing protein YiiM/ferredoxin
MVYQIESYGYWEKVLGRSDFVLGQFGENLTIDGLSDEDVCVGDRYRIGTVLFEVTQPRVTCYRLGLRMEQADMPSLVVAHRRPGFYMRVLEQGEIGAGDEISCVSKGTEAFSIADVDTLLYRAGRSADDLTRALRIPALSEGWKQSFGDLLKDLKATSSATNAIGSSGWTGFRDLVVSHIQKESDDVMSFTLSASENDKLPVAQGGQYVAVRVPDIDGKGPFRTRTYSLSEFGADGTYRISIKRQSAQGVTAYLQDHLHVGDHLSVAAPRGNFLLDPGDKPVVLMSGGIGITPLLAMLHAIAQRGERRPVWWIYVARDGAHHVFNDEVRSLAQAVPDFHHVIFYSRPTTADHQGIDYDRAGRADLGILQSLHMPLDADFYLCGPATFMSDLRSALGGLGVVDSRIHSEAFGGQDALTPGIAGRSGRNPHVPDDGAGDGPSVSFTRSGLTVAWSQRYKSLLELAEACDVPVRWSCRTGVCHNCQTALLEGQVKYIIEPLDPPEAGTILICCSIPSTEVELDL